METRILVAYASTHGSTQEVAERIAETLRSRGLEADLLALRNVRSLSGYRAVVIGAPLYMFHWHKDAHRFIAKHQKELSHLPVAIFAGGPIEKGDEKEFEDTRKQLDQELARYPWLEPLSIEIIGGKHDPASLHFPYTLIPALRQMPYKDLRDWEAIRLWTCQIAEQIQPVAVA